MLLVKTVRRPSASGRVEQQPMCLWRIVAQNNICHDKQLCLFADHAHRMASPQLFFDEEAGRNYDACDMCLTRALLHPLSILIRQGGCVGLRAAHSQSAWPVICELHHWHGGIR
jgi:hypothetical protein